MAISRKQLITDYVSAINDGNAALFVGAGMSRACGFVDWKELMRGCAEEIGLDLDKEQDLVAVAQYYLNLRAGNRWRLNQILMQEFDREGSLTENHEIIARLPVTTVWTTNFDTLLERALRAAGRKINVKSEDTDIASSTKRRDVTLYKMHGDIARPNEVVICKADYERYAHDHPVFQTTLESDLVSKTFLFLGFSFADPHLNYMLGHLHALLEGNQRSHFAILRRVRENFSKGEAGRREFEYEKNKQDLQIKELERYNIQTHLIDNFSEVADVLRAIEEASCRRNVFVSGSANKYHEEFGEDRMRDLCMHLGEMLMERDFKLISGFGLNIGDSVIKGALLRLYEKKDAAIESHVVLRPFPRNLPSHISEADFLDQYRRSMISQGGFAIFISGTSRSATVSSGVMDEYRIARGLKRVPIPIGATGFAAEQIWTDVADKLQTVYGDTVPASVFAKLNDRSLPNEEILRAVFHIIDRSLLH
jgi:hypothetical protein